MPAIFVNRVWIVLAFAFSILIIYAGADASETKPSDFVIIENKSLERYVDPLIIEGKYLPAMEKSAVSGLRLYSCLEQDFVPIPFQVDEKTDDGYKILPKGPQGNPEKANKLFDKYDELLFMAFDTGDKVQFAEPPINCKQFTEIEIIDPLNGHKGWVYLLYFDSTPPQASDKNYAGTIFPEHPTGYEVKTDYYTIKGKQIEHRGKKYNQIFYKKFTTPVSAGGTGVDYIDRLKWRVKIGFLFNIIKVSFDEDSLIGNFICWKMGPIRGTYRVWASATLPFGLKSPRFIADVVAYDRSISTSTALNVPFNPGYVITEIVTRIGTDMSPEAEGMMFFNSENLKGFKVDGVMSKAEKNFNKKRDTWRLLTGPQGTLMNRSTWSENFLDQAESVEVSYVDDISSPDKPEFHEGQLGFANSVARLKKLKPDKYMIFIEWYWPPHFFDPENPDKLNLEVVKHYLHFQDEPLKFAVEGNQGVNKAIPVPAKKWK